jgi:CHAT domain-containing protein
VVEDGVEKIAPMVERLRCQVDLKSCSDDAEYALSQQPISHFEDLGQLSYDQATAYELYRLLIKPVEPALTEGSDVFVMASGAMATLPLAMLVTEPPEDGYDWADYRTMRRAPWLSNRYAFTTTPSFDSFRPNRLKPVNNVSRDMLFAVADPAFDGQLRPGELRSGDFVTLTREGRLANIEAIRKLSPLPGTKAEYEAVRSALRTSEHVALLGTRATESALRQHPELAEARYILLATHGLLPGQNDRGLAEPALVLTPPEDATIENDGLLTASEVQTLNLRAEWVFLSACNTANAGGTGDSLSALASGFLRAGALQVMASHWPVLDDVTPALTTATLRASARNRRGGPGRALQRATRSVRDGRWPGGGRIEGWNESWAHPMAWAPFVLISNGDEAIVNKRFDTDWN